MLKIELKRAVPEDNPVLQNLAQLYAHDFSEFMDIDVDSNGKYGDPERGFVMWDNCWLDRDARRQLDRSTAEHHPFIVIVDGALAGFSMVKSNIDSPDDSIWRCGSYIQDFFIMRKFRGKGVGRYIAEKIFDMFPGKWDIEQLETNTPAIAFWRKVIDDYTSGQFEEQKGHDSVHQLFDNSKLCRRVQRI